MIERAGVNSTVAYIGADTSASAPVAEIAVVVETPVVDSAVEKPVAPEEKKKSK